MADTERDEQLKAMAQHRGLKLVKSRRRKPGVGDFGLFGLTDASGKPLLGIGKNELTATAEDVESYLRNDTLGTWKQSADTTAKIEARPRKPREDEEPSPRPARSKHNASGRAPIEKSRKAPEASPPQERMPEPEPEPSLVLRGAKSQDASALLPILQQLPTLDLDRESLTRNLAAISGASGGTIVAELGAMVGCCSWAALPTLHRGLIGRLTLIVVDKGHRRRGIGTALLGEAMQAMTRAGCTAVEAMSDIEIRNNHSFFRAREFQQTSYRFARKLG